MHKTSCTFFSRRNRKTYLTESLHETRRKHTRERNIYYYMNIYEILKIASIPCSYANVALSNCLFHTDPDVLLYPMEYYISKYI